MTDVDDNAGMEWSDRFDEVARELIKSERERRGWSQTELGEKTGTSQSTIQRIEKGERKITFEWAEKLSTALDIPIDKLFPSRPHHGKPLGAAGSPAAAIEQRLGHRKAVTPVTDDFAKPERIVEVDYPGRKDVPLFASARGGPEGAAIIDMNPIDYVSRPDSLARSRNAFAFYVIGDSMEPRYEQGDMALVDRTRPASKGDDVALLHDAGDGTHYALLKRLVSFDDRDWVVVQYNPPMELRLSRKMWQDAFTVVGRYNRR